MKSWKNNIESWMKVRQSWKNIIETWKNHSPLLFVDMRKGWSVSLDLLTSLLLDVKTNGSNSPFQ